MALLTGSCDNELLLCDIRKTFIELDYKNDGYLDKDELLLGLTQVMSEKDASNIIESLIRGADSDNEQIDYIGFLMIS